MFRRAGIVVALFAVLCSSAFAAGFKKPYFGQTKVDSWAEYETTDGNQYRYVRLADEDGQARIQIRADFSKTQYATTPPSMTQYTLDKGFPLDRNAISMTRFATAGLMHMEGSDVMPMEPHVVEAIRKGAADYSENAKFVATETVDGRKSDRYSYTVKFPMGGSETGDVWLSDTVPFGIVKQAATMKDDAGNVTSKYVMTLTRFGLSGSKATPLIAPSQPAVVATELSVLDAYSQGAVALYFEVGAGKGAKTEMSIQNRSEGAVTITVPRSFILEAADPVKELSVTVPSEQKFTIGPGAAQVIDVKLAKSVAGAGSSFELSVYDGELLFSGTIKQ